VSTPPAAPPAGAPGLAREFAAFALSAALFALLLYGVREVLAPPVVYGLFAWAVWPFRARSEVRTSLLAGGALLLLWFLHAYGGLLTPFLVALAVAYVIAPLVAILTRRGMRRGLAIVTVVVPILAAGAAVMVIAGPQLADQAQTVIARLPAFAERAVAWLGGVGERLSHLPFLSAEQRTWLSELDSTRLGTILQKNAEGILGDLGQFGLGLLSRVGSLVGLLAYLVVVPVVTFYLLSDWAKFLRTVRELIPPHARDGVMAFVEEYDGSLGRFIRGQLLEATLVGVLTTTGLAILGVPSAFLLGVIAGVFNLVPYVGLAISAVPALIVALTMAEPLGGLLRVGIVFAIVQFLDGSVTGPRIVGNSVGLHPLWIMIALTFSGAFFGFAGLLLAIPIAVLVKMVLGRAVTRYKASTMYVGENV
jgi:predicted PurR-regulated permease PerM